MLKKIKGTAYQQFGSVGAPCVVFIHGLGLNQQIWTSWVSAFSKEYCMITYDLSGHGQSDELFKNPDLKLYAQQLLTLLDALKIEQCVLVGFSLGGMINRRFAMDYACRVQALVILNSPHEREEQAQKLVEQRAIDTASEGIASTLEATIKRWFTARFIEENAEYIEQVRAWVLANNLRIYTQCRQVLAKGVIELIRPNPPITQPTLVMTCYFDSGSTPQMSQAIASEIKGSTVEIVAKLQHMGLCEQPQRFIRSILKFLKKL